MERQMDRQTDRQIVGEHSRATSSSSSGSIIKSNRIEQTAIWQYSHLMNSHILCPLPPDDDDAPWF